MKPDLGGPQAAPLVPCAECYLDRKAQDKTQLERFKEAARELGADNDEEQFEEQLKKRVKQKSKGG